MRVPSAISSHWSIARRGSRTGSGERAIEDVAIEPVAVGDAILVRAGEIIPVDGVITSPIAMLDEAALTGEPIPSTAVKARPRAAAR